MPGLAGRYRVTTEVHDFNRLIDPFEVSGDEVCERVVALLHQITADTRLDTQVGFWSETLPQDLAEHGFCEIVVGGSYTITVSPVEAA